MALTQQQKQLASILPRIIALMSWLGSVSIAVDVIRKYRKKGNSNSKPTTYHGLMLGMSFFDVCVSGGHAMTTLPVPSDTPGAYAAEGSEASCQAQAVFIQLGIGAVFYNLCLSVYYYLFIVKNVRPSRTLERCMHFVCFSFAFGTVAASLALGLFGYAGFWCWITREHDFYRWIFWYGPLWVIILCISAIMAAIYYDMARQEKRTRRWSIQPPTNNEIEGGAANNKKMTLREALRTIKRQRRWVTQPPTNNDIEEGTANNQEPTTANRNTRERKKGRASPRSTKASDSVKWQAFWYVGSFLLTWFFLTVVRGMQTAGQGNSIPTWIVLAAVALVPSQGFFNFMIYIKPRYAQYRKEHPETGRLVAFFRVNPLLVGCKCRLPGRRTPILSYAGGSGSRLNSRIANGLSGLGGTSTPTETGGSSASSSQEEGDEAAKDVGVVCTKETRDVGVMCDMDARDVGEC